jgi:hypothetical protein
LRKAPIFFAKNGQKIVILTSTPGALKAFLSFFSFMIFQAGFWLEILNAVKFCHQNAFTNVQRIERVSRVARFS